MNTDQLRSNAAAMLAHADGKPVQYKSFAPGADWRDLGSTGWEFTFGGGCFRPKPEPVVRPWSFEEAPISCKVRNRTSKELGRMCSFPVGVIVYIGNALPEHIIRMSYETAADNWEQLDGSPCGITP